MIFGDKNLFAIECEISERVDDWVFGCFLFWLCGCLVGDREDSTDLKGCLMWLKDFVNLSRNRFEDGLIALEKNDVFKILFNSVMQTNDGIISHKNNIDDIYSRFNIAHLGMSSFDCFDILLIEQPNGQQRCLWRSANVDEINECYMPNGEMQRVAKLCYTWLESEINKQV